MNQEKNTSFPYGLPLKYAQFYYLYLIVKRYSSPQFINKQPYIHYITYSQYDD